MASYLAGHPGLAIDPAALMDGKITVADALAKSLRRATSTDAPIVYSTAEPEAVAAAQKTYGARSGRRRRSSASSAKSPSASWRPACAALVVGGGETSGAVVAALGVDGSTIGPEIDPGVPALVDGGRRPIGLALKSGNFGAPDFFDKALQQSGGTG